MSHGKSFPLQMVNALSDTPARVLNRFSTVHSEILVIDIDNGGKRRKVFIKIRKDGIYEKASLEYQALTEFYNNQRPEGIHALEPLFLDEDNCAIAMEYSQGRSLRSILLNPKPLGSEELRGICRRSASALLTFHGMTEHNCTQPVALRSPFLDENWTARQCSPSIGLNSRVRSYLDFSAGNILIEGKDNENVCPVDLPHEYIISVPHLDLARFRFSLRLLSQYPHLKYLRLHWWNDIEVFRDFLDAYCELASASPNTHDYDLIDEIESAYARRMLTIYANRETRLTYKLEGLYLNRFLELVSRQGRDDD